MHGHTLRTGDAPNDVVHVDMKGRTCTCTDDELEALAAYFRALREKGEKRLAEPGDAARGEHRPTGTVREQGEHDSCVSCGLIWPCPTAATAARATEEDR